MTTVLRFIKLTVELTADVFVTILLNKLNEMRISGVKKTRNGSRYHVILFVSMWEACTLLLMLNSSCGATRYTRRNRHKQDHHTERVVVSLHHVYQRRKGLQEGENR